MRNSGAEMKKQTNAGYSLVEVLIALAITSVVLLTVVTLFYMGRRNVYSGKQTTYAVSVGTRIMEDISGMAMSDLMGGGTSGSTSYFNVSDGTTLGSVSVNGIGPGSAASGKQTFANSILRNTASCTSNGATPPVYSCPDDSPTTGYTCPGGTAPNKPCYLSRWRALVNNDKLANAEVGLVLTPRWATGQTAANNNTTFLKIRAYVSWDETQGRRRIAFFDTTKVNRQ
jgi:prepilin-type N-terminal cleavage/methylation domain-containing protein